MGDRLRVAGLAFAWALIVIGVLYMTALGAGGPQGLYFTFFRVTSVGIIVVALAVWIAIGLRHPFWRPRSLLTPAILVFLAALAIGVAGSDAPRLGTDFVAYGVLLAGGYWFLQRLFAHPFFGPRLGGLSVLLCLVISVAYLGIVFYSWIQLWVELGRIVSPPLRPFVVLLGYGNANPIAAGVVVLWLASVAHLGVSSSRNRWAVAGLSGLSGTAVFLTGSRGAWFALTAAALVLIAVWLVRPDHRRRAVALLRSRRAKAAAVVGGIAFVLVGMIFAPALAGRVGDPAADTRSAFASASLGMLVGHPVTGVGPGMWVVDRIAYTSPSQPDLYAPHAHNIVLQTLAELGLVGVLAGTVVVVLLLRLTMRGLQSPDPLTRRLAWAALFGGVYLLGHQMFDFFAGAPVIGFLYALTVARLDALVALDRPAEQPALPYSAVATALVLAISGSVLWLAHSEEAAFRGDEAVSAANGGDWTSATARAAIALAHDPDMPPYLFTLGLAQAHTGNLTAAVKNIRMSAEVDDYPIAWLDVARLELDLGKMDEARRDIERSMRLGYQQPEVAFGASTMYLEMGDRSAAAGALAAALVAAPTFASDPYWRDPTRRPLLDAALSAALAEAPPSIGYRIALEGGHVDDARQIVAALPVDERFVPDLVVRAWAGDTAAFERLHSEAIADPLDGETITLCGRLAASHDQDGSAKEDWTCDRVADAPTSVVRVGSSSAWEASLPGPNAAFHFLFVYRRAVPDDLLVPGLPHLALASI